MNQQRISNVLNWCIDNAPEDIALQAEELVNDLNTEIDHTELEVGKSLGLYSEQRKRELAKELKEIEKRSNNTTSRVVEGILNNSNFSLRECAALLLYVGSLLRNAEIAREQAHNNIKEILEMIKKSIKETK